MNSFVNFYFEGVSILRDLKNMRSSEAVGNRHLSVIRQEREGKIRGRDGGLLAVEKR